MIIETACTLCLSRHEKGWLVTKQPLRCKHLESKNSGPTHETSGRLVAEVSVPKHAKYVAPVSTNPMNHSCFFGFLVHKQTDCYLSLSLRNEMAAHAEGLQLVTLINSHGAALSGVFHARKRWF